MHIDALSEKNSKYPEKLEALVTILDFNSDSPSHADISKCCEILYSKLVEFQNDSIPNLARFDFLFV